MEPYQEILAAADPAHLIRTLSAAYLQITRQWGDVIRVVTDRAARRRQHDRPAELEKLRNQLPGYSRKEAA